MIPAIQRLTFHILAAFSLFAFALSALSHAPIPISPVSTADKVPQHGAEAMMSKPLAAAPPAATVTKLVLAWTWAPTPGHWVASGFQVQQTNVLPPNWQTIATIPNTLQTNFTYTITNNSAQAFFRVGSLP